jgi:hypothetical protein
MKDIVKLILAANIPCLGFLLLTGWFAYLENGYWGWPFAFAIMTASGAAKANKIIGESLKSNEAYLHYLFINNMEHTQNQVIYIPTETGLPILEAGKRYNKEIKP